MIYNFSMFGTKVFEVTVNYDVTSIQATGSFEKCDRTVFKTLSPTDDFETIKNGITRVARLLQYFPGLSKYIPEASLLKIIFVSPMNFKTDE